MSSSKLTTSSSSSFLLLISLALLLQTGFGAIPLFSSCSSENITTHNPYESNLKTLIRFLNYKTPPTGFGLGSVGQYPNKAHGLALCRGDVSTSDCKTCVKEATREIQNCCPNSKHRSFIYYDNCMVKYMDEDFFGQIDNVNKFYLLNPKNVSEPTTFNYKTKTLLSQLADKASLIGTKLYATGEVELEESKKLYGLIQCTRDLSREDCQKCLDDAISDLPNCCDGKEGGRVVGASCNIRYEIYPFFKA
ncbi:Cysteine-rich repeat secretory protein [Quillaja saponaria]|uniref:Cysteine-rich repeat secretory protein n=1 Tax=Quillaja saponaria TaxID=32244 RepID=A0AAD7VMC9_QUISA|nr:Cysteine-rich repeat secretory protein [Quillaja saponaria]